MLEMFVREMLSDIPVTLEGMWRLRPLKLDSKTKRKTMNAKKSHLPN